MAPIELTEKLLADAGGWQAMKAGRELANAGAVSGAVYEPPHLKGTVREGGREYRAGLRIVTRTNIENLCTCRAARQWGTICNHSLAVGISVLNPKPAVPSVPTIPQQKNEPNAPQFLPEGTPGAIPLTIQLILPPTFRSGIERNRVGFVVEASVEGRRAPISSLSPRQAFSCPGRDLRFLSELSILTGGVLPAHTELGVEQFATLLRTVAVDAPRITIGRDKSVSVPELLAWLPSDAPETSVNRQSEGELPQPAAAGFELDLEGSLNHLTAVLTARYGEFGARVGTRTQTPSHIRDAEAESSAQALLQKAGFAGPDGQGTFVLKGEQSILRFFGSYLPLLQKQWRVTLGTRFANVTGRVSRIQPQVEIKPSGTGWFDLTFQLASATGERFSAHDIRQLIQSGQSHIKTKRGEIAVFDANLLEEFQEVIRDCDPRQTQPGSYRINAIHAGAILDVCGTDRISAPHGWIGHARALLDPAQLPTASLSEELDSILRPYQRIGVNWLNALAERGAGGILADEMGLGKTIQVLAFLTTRKAEKPSIVVCPTSLIFNWEQEAARFAPGLKVVRWESPSRRVEQLQGADLILTSYGILRRDGTTLGQLEYDVVVLDEAQHVKNPQTQAMQSAKNLRGRCRVVLTGTPLENRLRDLWSLVDFAIPGYLGTLKAFGERYESIEVDQTKSSVLISRKMRPFLLRRTKNEYARELPEKIEKTLLVELTPEQARVYNEIVQHSWRELDDMKRAGSQNQMRICALKALLRLRQSCCDLALLGPMQQSKPKKEGVSAKRSALNELLEEIIDGNHKALIFSQFVEMLRILRNDLDGMNISFCYLDGASKDRPEQARRFQSDNAIPVFLISLKAGGTGLNLQSADTVIHFDPWWNPAAEAQATDRAHRIGQSKVVTSYKLIAKGTVEEKILGMQEKKRRIFNALFDGDGQGGQNAQSLTVEEIQELLTEV